MQYNNGIIQMMTVVKNKPTAVANYIDTFKDKWRPWSKAKVIDGNLHYATLKSGQWLACDEDQLPRFTIFAKLALLLPATVCAFRIRTFPLHMVSAKELHEAVALDYVEWSPWRQDSGYCYSYVATADEWQVSIWVWDKQYAQSLMQSMPYCTHIIPELAWYGASAPPQPALMIVAEQSGFNYLFLGESGNIQAAARISEQQQALRYWHGWGVPDLKQGWEINQPHDYWAPETVTMQALPAGHNTPHAKLLRITRVQGVRDWADPRSYQAVITLLLVTLFSWMLVDALVLNHLAKQIQTQLNLVRNSADDVLTLREQVETAQELIQQAVDLRRQQQLPEQVLAQLSMEIPKDIYLKSVLFEGDQLDLEGQGKQVARLMVLLEKLPGVAKVMLINDILRNTDTDEELFQIRVILKT
ncbi:MAG: PilN domain-containing protein [Methylococcales bacterium]